MATPTAEEPQADRLARLGNLAPSLLGATAIGAATVFLMGWQYEKAYIEEWELAFSAFSYSPYELMISSTVPLIWASLATLILAALWFVRQVVVSGLGRHPPDWLSWNEAIVLFLSGSCAIVVGTIFAVYLDGNPWIWLSVIWFGFLTLCVTAARFQAAMPPLVVIQVLIAILYVVVAPPMIFGSYEAKRDKADPSRLPRVEVNLRRSIGIDGERRSESGFITGPWRLIRSNEGRLWLTPDSKNSGRVLQIDSADIASIEYTDSQESSPTLTPQPIPSPTP
jgi:hypothetical protein